MNFVFNYTVKTDDDCFLDIKNIIRVCAHCFCFVRCSLSHFNSIHFRQTALLFCYSAIVMMFCLCF